MILAVCANPAIDSLAEVDSLRPGEVHRMRSESYHPGGKGVHVAMAAAELGEEVELLGFWAGPTGAWIRDHLAGLGIRSDGVTVPGWTRLCYAFRSKGEYDETELLGAGPEVSPFHSAELLAGFEQRLPKAKVAVLSGSLPRGAEHSLYASMIRAARARNVPVILDTSGASLMNGLSERPYGLHLNQREAAELTGEADPYQAARRLDLDLVALTAGQNGLYLRFRNQLFHANVTIERTASAVGSGDCLTAGVAVALARGLSAEQTASLAVACGAANCLRAEIGMIHRRDVELLLARVAVKSLEGR